MFKVGQQVLATENNDVFDAGKPGVVIEADDHDESLPYLVEYVDGDEPYETWCREEEIEADGEVIE